MAAGYDVERAYARDVAPSVGCWFCGLSADRFKGYYDYSKEHAELWHGVVGVASEMFGSAASTGVCYWATEPMDNPHACFNGATGPAA